MDISVIVPVYNGEKTIEKLFEGINENLKSHVSFEVLFVFDCGSDNSWEILKKLQKNNPQKIRIFKLKKNYGQHNAILFGISESEGDYIITMDEDLQHDPYYLGPLLEKQRELNYSVVYARFLDPKHPFFRKLASGILQKLLKILIPGLGYYSSFRLIKKDAAQKITLLKSSYTFIDASLKTITSDFGFLDIDHRENTTRKSTYNLFRLVSHAIQIILAYSRIIKWLLIISVTLILFAWVSKQFDLTGSEMQMSLIITGIFFLLLGVSGELFYRWKIKTNSLPVIAIESY
jgi:undecaprenyl-phosphate 4-deoxy-4-formamido-L-arabinose transferase